MKRVMCAFAWAVATVWAGSASAQAQSVPAASHAVRHFDAGLGRGVNFGNMLEAPSEGAWGLTVQEIFFDKVVEAGLDHIRLPVSWTHHASLEPPFTINPQFMDRVQWCVDRALARGLKIIVNTHHYDALNANPAGERARALAIWHQVAKHFADHPATLYFEVLNEPHGAFNQNPQLWNAYFADALSVIRATNPDRWVLVGPTSWNAIGALSSLVLPDDPRLVVSVHYYDPFDFTHQGASWVTPTPPIGTTWTGQNFVMAAPWQNWSWNTRVTGTGNGIEVEHTAGWAGLYFRRAAPKTGATNLTFTIDGAASLRVIFGDDSQEGDVYLQPPAGISTHTVTIPSGLPPLTKVMFQNATPNPATRYTLRSVSLSGVETESLIATERESLQAALRAAADWAFERERPLHLGEFGAYSPGDITSRAEWTKSVRREAERLGIEWAYWELAAGFGFYNPQTGEWNTPLLRALTERSP